MSKTDNVAAAQQSQAQAVLEYVSQGVSTATELVKAMGVSKGRISQLTTKLLKEKRLTRRGRVYSLPKKRKFTSDSAPQIASRAAPVQDAQAEALQSAPAKTVLEGHFRKKGRHAAQPVKTGSEDMLSREHWHAYTSPSTISQETGLPLSHMLRSTAKELVDNALDSADRHGCPGSVTGAMAGSHTIIG